MNQPVHLFALLSFESEDFQKSTEQVDSLAEQRLKLETERQEVLGKLSFLSAKSQEYVELDQRFIELTKKIKRFDN
ncbi:MAG TPA: hypothetical protein VGI04_02870 [Neobacillus sp.]